jgi:transcriptional regulator with GAF, ATPase, and Fis domain
VNRLGWLAQDWTGRTEAFPGVVCADTLTSEVTDIIRRAAEFGRHWVVVVDTGSVLPFSYQQVTELLDAGADDVLPCASPETTASRIVRRLQRWDEIETAAASPDTQSLCVGSSREWDACLRRLVECALFGRVPVLLTGESGTGKELAARLLHALDRRQPKGAFVIVDCSTIQRELSGSELFGHVKGAYTGAVNDRDGAFNLAHEGTLFLDEIGELPLALQAELLRVIQEGMYKAVGSNVWKSAAFRLICASNRDLRNEVHAGRFREDLFHRIAGQELRLPSLRERIGDVSVLARYFVRQVISDEAPGFAPEFLQFLESQVFPGNVRELRQLILRSMQRYPGEGPITLGLLHPADRRRNQAAASDWRQLLERPVERAVNCGVALKDIGREAEEMASRIALAMEGGNLPRAARRLHLSDRALQLRVASRRNAEALWTAASGAPADMGSETDRRPRT